MTGLEEDIQKYKAKILVVEDEPLIGWSVSKALRKAGLWVDHVDTGEKAVQKLRSTTYDLVLTDLKLPQINGFEVASVAKSVSGSIPVIVISAMDERIIHLELEKGVVDFYIEKPFDLDEMTSVVLRFALRN
jgi:two-component system OmpR family response regulator/two-component system response regulator QseB